MNTQTTPLLFKQSTTTVTKKVSLLRVGAQVMDTVLSMVLSAFAAIFFMWLNGRQHEFDELQDKA